MSDRQMTEFLSGVVGVVEANSFEISSLWAENRRRKPSRTWKENSFGLGETIGHLGGMPVFISLVTAEVDGHKLLFVDATSRVVDHRMVDEWLDETLPKSAFREDGYVNKTNAMNFHNVFPVAAPVDRAVSTSAAV